MCNIREELSPHLSPSHSNKSTGGTESLVSKATGSHRARHPVTLNTIHQMLKNWKKQGLITQTDSGGYKKVQEPLS